MADSAYKDPNGQAPGQSTEKVNSQTGAAGLYRHENGTEVITLSDPLYGDAQSEAAIRVGFVRVGDTPKGAVKELALGSDSFAARPQAGLDASSDAIKGLLARVNAQEAELAKLREASAKGVGVSQDSTPGSEQAKVDGIEAVNAQARTSQLAGVQNVNTDATVAEANAEAAANDKKAAAKKSASKEGTK